MPKHRIARAPLDARDEHRMRVLTRSTPAPADWIFHATMVALSWDGLRTW